jgi:hypothetical protein
MFGNRNVLAQSELMAVEFEARLLVIGPFGVRLEHPPSARAVHQVSDIDSALARIA